MCAPNPQEKQEAQDKITELLKSLSPEAKKSIEGAGNSVLDRISNAVTKRAKNAFTKTPCTTDICKLFAPHIGFHKFICEIDQEARSNMNQDRKQINFTLALFMRTKWPALAAEHLRETSLSGEPAAPAVLEWLASGLEKSSGKEAAEALGLTGRISRYSVEIRSRWTAAMLATLETVFALPQACSEEVLRNSGFSGTKGLYKIAYIDKPVPVQEVRQARRDFARTYEEVEKATRRHRNRPYAPAALLFALLLTGSHQKPPQRAEKAFNRYMELGWNLDNETFGIEAMRKLLIPLTDLGSRSHHVTISSIFNQVVGGHDNAQVLLWSDILKTPIPD